MAKLNELKSYLRDLNYPGINIMQDEEVADIFQKKNRLYFLSWFVQQWDADILLPMDEKDKANIISEFLCDNGFCTSKKAIRFVQDDFDLKPDEQVISLIGILHSFGFFLFNFS